jgi:hypothetical protein
LISFSRIKKVHSRKRFKEDSEIENVAPNTPSSQNSNIYNRPKSELNQYNPNFYASPNRKIEFTSLSPQLPTHLSPQKLFPTPPSPTQIPSPSPILIQIHQIEQKLTSPFYLTQPQQPLEANEKDFESKKISSLYHNTTQSWEKDSHEILGEYERRKALALKELDYIIATSEEEETYRSD